MKQLIFILTVLFSFILFQSCEKENNLEEKKEVKEEVKEEIIGGVFSRNIHMRDGTSIDTLYYNKGIYSTELIGFEIFGKITGRDDGIGVTENDTIIKVGGKILGRAEFYPNTYVKRIEMYDWFTLSEINVNGKKAFELRSTGTNPDSLLLVISAKDSTVHGPLDYCID